MALGDFELDPVEAKGIEQRGGFVASPPDHWYNGLEGMFVTDPEGTNTISGAIKANPIASGIGQGMAKGLSLLAGAVHGAADGVDASDWSHTARMVWGYKPGSIQEAADQTDQFARDTAKKLAPDPKSQGAAATMIQGLADVGSTAAFATMATRGAGGGAAITAAVEGYAKYRDLIDQGVDHDTAQRLGGLEGLTTGAALVAPYSLPIKMLGFTGNGVRIAAQMATGSVVNTGLSAVNRYASHQILESAGYPEMAEQYKVMDGTAMASDAALGAIFGYLGDHHSVAAKQFQDRIETAIKGHEANLSAMADAAMTVRLAHIDATDLAPGLPATPGAAGAHKAALEKALADLSAGRPVDVSDTGVAGQTFVPKPAEQNATGDLFAQVLKEEFDRVGVPEALSGVDAAERTLAARRGEVLPEPVSVRPTAETRAPETSTLAAGFKPATPEELAAHTAQIEKPLAQRLREADGAVPTEPAEYEADRAHDARMRAETEGVAPEFAREPKAYQDMTVLRLKAHEVDPDATEVALESQADDSVVAKKLQSIIADGRARSEHANALREQRAGPVSERGGGGEVLRRQGASGAGGESGDTGADHAQSIVDAALAERPELSIVDDTGREVSAVGAHESAEAHTQQTEHDAPKMFDAAVNCFLRHGS